MNKDILIFLNDLKENNNKDWFSENKERYNGLKSDFIKLVNEMIEEISKFDQSVERQEAKNCIFRIYRDTRFSVDKSPYKTNFGAAISLNGKELSKNPGYYLHIEPNQCFLAGGSYMPDSATLKKIRTYISQNPKEFSEIIHESSFQKLFSTETDALKKVPQGFDKNDPMGDYLKFKNFLGIHHFDQEKVCQKDFVKYAVEVYKKIFPYNQFIHKAIHSVQD